MEQRETVRNLGYLGGLCIFLLILPDQINVYYRSFTMFTMMYVVLALSWNIISGYTGYINFGHVLFYGVGSYASAILVADYGWNWIPTLIISAAVGVVVASCSAFPYCG